MEEKDKINWYIMLCFISLFIGWYIGYHEAKMDNVIINWLLGL